MPLIRSIFLLLMFANLVFFAWDRGYFGEPPNGHEGQRLKAQIHPEKIRIISTAKPTAPEACRIVGNLRLADAQTLRSTLAQRLPPDTRIVLSQAADPGGYDVLISDLASRTVANSKIGDLTKLGITDAHILTDEKGKFSLVLASFDNERGARDYLQAHKGLRTAKVATRPANHDRAQLLVRGSQATVVRVADLIGGVAGATTTECPTP